MTTIITKNSSTASAVPAAGSLVQGELAVNVTDKKLYTKDSGGTVQKIVGSLGNQEASSVAITGGSITGITDLAIADGGTGASTASDARNNLGLGSIATQNSNSVSITGGSITGITDLAIADGGTGASDAVTARTNLGLGSISTQAANSVAITGGSITGITDLAIADGGTGASTANDALNNLLPSQASASGKYLKSDGTNASWDQLDISTADITGTLPVLNGGTGATTASGARTNLGVTATGSDTTYAYRANNLSDLANATTARTNLGLGSIATQAASSVAITGGTIDGTAIGGTTTAAGAFTTLAASGAVTLSGGTANGVAYLNGSKVLTTGSALTFDGAVLSSGRVSATSKFEINTYPVVDSSGGNVRIGDIGNNIGGVAFFASGSEQMRLTSTGLGIGTTSPVGKIGVVSGTTPNIATLYVGVSGSNNYYDANTHYFRNGSQVDNMVLTTGGLGIGTSSPSEKLSVAGNITNTGVATFGTSGSNTYVSLNNNGYLRCDVANWFTLQAGSNGYQWRNSANSSTAQMTLDSSGNLGLGVTPPALGYGRQLTVSQGAGTANPALVHQAVNTDDERIYLTNNMAFATSGFSGNYTYVKTGASASYYLQTGGSHRWYTAPSGTAGNTIAFTQAMTLDASGRLGVGTTSPVTTGGSLFEISNSANCLATITCTNDTTSLLDFRTNSVDRLQIQSSSNWGAYFLVRSNQDMKFGTNNTERARITSAGDLLVGGTGVTNRRVYALAPSNYHAGSFQSVTTGYATLEVVNSSGSGTRYLASFRLTNGGADVGNITTDGTNTAYNTSSDYRLKNIDGPLTGSGEFIDALKPKVGTWKADGSKFVGFLAHEVQEVSPQSVVGTKDAVDEEGNPIMQAMEYGSAEFIANIVAELQSLRARVAQLESKGA